MLAERTDHLTGLLTYAGRAANVVQQLIYQLTATLPTHQPGSPGRLPHHPPWVHVLHKALAGILGSHSKAACVMAHPVSHSDPARGQFVGGGGTVVAAPVRKATAERWAEQGGRGVHAGIEVQNGDNDPNGRCDGVCYEGAFRGSHIDHCMKRGLTVLSLVHDGTAKLAALTQLTCGCGDTHDLWTQGGRIYERQILDAGHNHLQACPTDKIFSGRNADDSHRWYLEFAIPSCGTVHRKRIDTTATDRERGHNRAEHLRQHVKTDDGDNLYDRCYGWREDAESLNNTLDRTLYGGCMIAYSEPPHTGHYDQHHPTPTTPAQTSRGICRAG